MKGVATVVATINGERWLSLEAVAERLACHVNTVRALIRCDRLAAKRMRRGRWWVREVELVAWLAQPDNKAPTLTVRTNR